MSSVEGKAIKKAKAMDAKAKKKLQQLSRQGKKGKQVR